MLVIIPLARTATAQQQAGYVFELSGNWYLAGRPPRRLSVDDPLPAGAVVTVESPRVGDHIVVMDNGGEIVARRRCGGGDNDECLKPIGLGVVRKSSRPGKLHLLVESVMTLLLGEHDVYVPLRSRGIGGAPLREAVVRLQDGKVDLAPVLVKLSSRTYTLRMREVAGPGGPAPDSWLGPVRLDWTRGGEAALRVPGLRPGLYQMTLLNMVNGVLVPDGDDAWVLVSGPAAYADADAAHRDAQALAEEWKADVTPDAARGFLRAHLAHLAGRRKTRRP